MSALCRLTALLAVACLAGGAFGTPGAVAQNAGNQQPQASSSTQTSGQAPTTPSSAAQDPADRPQLAPNAGGTTTGSKRPSTPSSTTTKAPTSAKADTLPNTGVDGRILAGLGLGLLLCGVGLRLRTARERF